MPNAMLRMWGALKYTGNSAVGERRFIVSLLDFAKDFLLRQNCERPLGAGEDAVDNFVSRLIAAPLEPEDNIRLSRHGPDIDLLLAPDQTGGRPSVYGVQPSPLLLFLRPFS